MIGTHTVKVRREGAKRWDFLTSNGGTTHLRIHAISWNEKGAREVAERLPIDNPGVEAKVVAF